MGFLEFGKGSDKAAGSKDYLREAEHGLRDAGRYLNQKKLDVSAAGTAYMLAKSSLTLAQGYLNPKNKDRYERVAAGLKETGRRIVEATSTSAVRRLAEAQRSMESGDRIRGYEQSTRDAGAGPDPDVQKILDEMHKLNPGAARRIEQQEAEKKSIMRGIPYTNTGYDFADRYIRMAEGNLKTADGIAEDLGDDGLRTGLEAVKETVKQMKKNLESREKRTEEEL